MSDKQFVQRGAAYTETRKKKFQREQLPKADLPPNVDLEKPNLPVIALRIYDSTTPHSKTKSYFNPLAGWNNEKGHITVSWQKELTRSELKGHLELLKRNKNIVQRIRLESIYEDEPLVRSRVSITAVALEEGVSEKDRFRTLWTGILDPETGTVEGQFVGSTIDVLNIFDNCTRNRGTGEKPDMVLRIYRPKDSIYKPIIEGNPTQYVPARKEKKEKAQVVEEANEITEITETTEE